MTRRYALLTTASILAAAASTPAFAQQTDEAQQQAADVATADVAETEIVVTAQKREQRLVDVPMAVSVVTGEELEEQGIENVQDLSFAVPGLTMREDGPGSYTIFLRGLANQSGSGALVSLYLDEAPLSLSGYDQLSPATLDLARVEVLKGPQGTLYGQGSAGGTVRYITNRPNLSEIEGRVEAQAYTVSHGEPGGKGTAIISIPLIKDQLAFRFAGSYQAGGGWQDQPEAGIKNGNGTKLLNLRGKLLYAPTDRFEAQAMVQIHRAKTKLGMGYEEADRTVEVGPDRSKVMIPKQFDFDIYNLTLSYDFGFAELVSATTYVTHDHQYPFSYIPRPGNFSYGFVEGNDDRFVEGDQFSQELRLASSGAGPFDWTVGAFYRKGERSLLADYEYAYAPNGDLYSGGGVLYDDLFYFSESSSENYSIFADAAYDITDRLTLGAGLRYFEDKATSLIEYAPNTGEKQSATFDSVDPRVYVSYEVNPRANIYASWSKGFRSGGFNSEPFEPYAPEKVYNYEVGFKGSTAGSVFQWDVAAFYTKYEDMVRRRLVLVDGAFLSESSNIGQVEVKGVEAGFAVHPIPPLTLNMTAAYIDSEITKTDASDVVNLPGDRTDYTPKLSYTLGANYELFWAPDVPGFVRVDYNYRDAVSYIDRSSFFPDALPQKSDKLNLLNARIGATFGRFNTELFALNLTNENDSIDPYQGWANANRTRPRVVGIEVGYSF